MSYNELKGDSGIIEAQIAGVNLVNVLTLVDVVAVLFITQIRSCMALMLLEIGTFNATNLGRVSWCHGY